MELVHALQQLSLDDARPRARVVSACGIKAFAEQWACHSVNVLECEGVGHVRMTDAFTTDPKYPGRCDRKPIMFINPLITCERCKINIFDDRGQ